MNSSDKGTSIFRNVIFNLIYKSLNIIFPIISAGYAARVLTPNGIGRNAIAQNNVSYFLIIALLGIYAYSIREVSRCRENKKELEKLFSEIMIINACLTTVALVAFVISLFLIDSFRNDIALYLICGIVLGVNYINFDWFFQATEEYKFIAVRSFAIKLLSLISLFLFVHEQSDFYVFALINSVAICGHYLLNVFRAGKTVSFTIKNLNIKRHLKPLFMLALCGVSSEIYSRLDISMLGIIKDETTVAYYTYSQRIVNLIVGLIIAITAVFLPRLSFYFTTRKEEFNRLTKIGVDIMIFLSIPISCGIAAVSNPLIHVWLGSEYSEVIPCLIVLAFIIPLKSIGDIICYQVMICAGRESTLMIAYAVTLFINAFANLMLIPSYGAFGACLASFISEIFCFVFVLIFARRYQEYSIDRRNCIVVAVSSLIMMGIVILVESYIVVPVIELLVGILVGVLSFIIMNLVSGNNYIAKMLLSKIKNSNHAE